MIVGLGNPGKKYERTRHNMGYLAVQQLAHELGWVFKEEKQFHALVAKGNFGDHSLSLLLPTTYMNESGKAVRAYLDYFKLSPVNLVVVNDDVELPYGQIRLRPKGSAGGHNGLKSIESHLGTQHYVRLRLGIGRGENRALVDHVLENFSQEEHTSLPEYVAKGAAAIKLVVTHAIADAMQQVNAKIKGTAAS